MQVNRIPSNNYSNQPNFGMLKFDKSATPLLKKLSAKELKEVRKLEMKAAKTKRWNLTISSIRNGSFYAIFDDSYNLKFTHCGSLESYKLNKNKVHVHSYSQDDDILDTLRFPTAKRARKVYNSMYGEYYNLSPFEQIKKFVNALKYLDESYEYMAKNPIIKKAEQVNVPKTTTAVVTKPAVQETVSNKKLSITQRIKNAWQALKGN